MSVNAVTARTLLVSLALGMALLAVPRVGGCLQLQSALNPIRITARPGETVVRSFNLSLAREEVSHRFTARLEDWWQNEEGSQSFYEAPGTLARSCGTWTTLSPVEKTVAPGESLDVRVGVAIPSAVGPGGYWCVLTMEEEPDPLTAPAGVGVQFLASVSVGIFVNVEPVHREAFITDVKVAAQEARVRVENRGDTPLSADGRFEFLKPGTLEKVATALIARRTVVTAPVKAAWLTASLPAVDVLPSGRYVVRAVVDVGLDHYVGVQKEMEVERHVAAGSPPR